MPQANVNGIKLYYIDAGSGEPIVFVHEFAGDYRSWDPQVRYFSRRYRCIAYNARGYPPSEVPGNVSAYSQDHATDDIAGVMRFLDIPRAHIVGLSMGGFAALHFGLRYPDLALSIVSAGVGYGALPANHEQFAAEARAMAARVESENMNSVANDYASSPYRLPYKRKDPRGWQDFANQLAHHSTQGSALTLRGYQARRPAFTEFEDKLKAMTVPTLIVAGDEDEPSLEPSLYLKRTIPSAALYVLPKTGHAINLEEPALFNAAVQDFIDTVKAGRWEVRALAARTKIL
ncbi:MAG: alpha/beta hydrolase [Gammaproteobacteria bacterium]